MLEILLLTALTRQIGGIVEQKGYKSGSYKILTVVLWFGGEILGAIIGAIMTAGEESAQCLIYLVALVGAAAGAGIAYSIANNLAVIGPSLVPTATEQPLMTASERKLPAPVLALFWLIAGVLANVSWTALYNWFNPTYEESLFTLANLAAGVAAGVIAGLLQWLILLLGVPKVNRWLLVSWIPVTILGWAIGASLYTFVTGSTGMYFLISAVTGLVLGILQWVILQKFSKAAIWWIPANVVDWVAAWILGQSSFMLNVPDPIVYSILIGVVGSITSSIALIFILGKTFSASKAEDNTPIFLEQA
jgi:hypothetical protein